MHLEIEAFLPDLTVQMVVKLIITRHVEHG